MANRMYDTSKSMDNMTIMEFEYGENYELYVIAAIYWKLEGYDGIGEYEYHGQIWNDEGDAIWEIERIILDVQDEFGDTVEVDEATNKSIMQHIVNNAEPDFD